MTDAEPDGQTVPCTHLDQIRPDLPEPVLECGECVAMRSWWVHLRQCLICGSVGCCDSSPNQHTSRHVEATGHPLVKSLELGEDWIYCYPDDVGMIP